MGTGEESRVKMKKRIYIAGPMSKGDRIDNLANAMKAFRTLLDAGFAPFCPHMSFFLEPFVDGANFETWLSIDLPWVSVADAMLRLPGESKGADMEVMCALENNIPVFYRTPKPEEIP